MEILEIGVCKSLRRLSVTCSVRPLPGQNIMERKLGLIQTRAATVRQAALTKKEEDGRIRREQLALVGRAILSAL